MKENITVVFATDDNYAQHTGVAMASVLLHAAEPGRFTFFIIDDNISFHKKQQLTDTAAQFGARIEFLAAGNQFDNVYISAHLSRAAYLRLAIGDLLPSRNRVIYLDADLIVRKDLAQLYDSNMHNNTIAAVLDLGILTSKKSMSQKRKQLSWQAGDKYFNSGVIMFDLNRWREKNYGNKVCRLVAENKFRHHDQDALNYVLKDDWLEIPLNWNVIPPISLLHFKILMNGEWRKMAIEARRDPAVIHFAGSRKPWEYPLSPGFNEEYYFVLARTAFANESMPTIQKGKHPRPLFHYFYRKKIADLCQQIFD